MGGAGYNIPRSPQDPRGVQVLEGRQIAANHLLRRADDTLHPALVLGSGSSVPDGDGGGEDTSVHFRTWWSLFVVFMATRGLRMVLLYTSELD